MTDFHLAGPASGDTEARPPVEIDFHFLDNEVCGRCRETGAQLDATLKSLRPVAELLGVGLDVRNTKVESAEQARELGFVSSPTILVNGADIAPEIEESVCEPCGDLCGCGEDFQCRVWRWRGEVHRAAPAGLIAEAVLRALVDRRDAAKLDRRQTVEPPLQLRQFFEHKQGSASTAGAKCC